MFFLLVNFKQRLVWHWSQQILQKIYEISYIGRHEEELCKNMMLRFEFFFITLLNVFTVV